MRNGQNKRMRGRNRNNKGHHGGGGGGGHHHNPLTRVYESNGQDVKIRGTAHTIAEKYLQLARDAATSGDHVTAENHYQHAEHYFRLIAAAQEQFRQQNPYYQPQQPPQNGDGGGEASFEDGEDDAQPAQGQPQHQGLPPQNSQPAQHYNPQNFGNQQPNYPREQPQPSYAGPQHQQPRQHQPNVNSQQPSYQPQQFAQPQPVSVDAEAAGLPSFITGGQPQPAGYGSNGHDNQNGGDRFPRHRRRRHRGGGPRSDMQGGAQDFQSEGEPDGPTSN
jgi:hypothetical protein